MRFKSFFLFFFVLFFCLTVFALSGPIVSSSTHPDQSAWYRDGSPEFEFELEGASGYSFEFDRFADTVPDEVSDSTVGEYSVEGNKDNGEWFFHVRARVSGEWSDTTHYSVKIDKVIPSAAKNVSAIALDTSSLQLSWEHGDDAHSGIKGYKIYRGLLLGFSITDSSTVVATELAQGTSFVDTGLVEGVYYHYRIQSVDNAGNLGALAPEIISKTATVCDLVVEMTGSAADDVFALEIVSDDLISSADLKVTLTDGDVNNVFSNISGKNEFVYSFDLSGLPPGKIVVDFSGEDAEGDECAVSKEFFIDETFPSAGWGSPQDSSLLSGVVQLKASAVDEGVNPSGVLSVEFFYDDGSLQKIGDGSLSDGSYVFDWDTESVTNNRYPLVVRVTDFAGNFTEDEIIVTVRNLGVISGEAQSAISLAEDEKLVALETKALLDSLGVSLSSFDSLFAKADANLSSAKSAFDAGFNFERAISEADTASGLFAQAVSSVELGKYKSINFSYPENELFLKFDRGGLESGFVSKAVENYSNFNPLRRVDVYEIVDGVSSFYVAQVVISFNSDENVSLKVVEVVSKEFAESAFDFVSVYDFSVLNPDPVLTLEVNLQESKSVSYSLNKKLTRAEADALSSLEPDELFFAPPIVFLSSENIPNNVAVPPIDLFKQYAWFFELDLISMVLLVGGALFVVSLLLAIVSIILIVLIVRGSKRK